MQPKVGIILVNYNGFKDTVECVESLKKITYPNYKIFVVDNASTKIAKEDELDYLRENTELICSDKNLGFSGGNNIGIRSALRDDCDYILLLNNDTTVEPDFLDVLVNGVKANADVGIACGKIRFYREPEKLWFAGGDFDSQKGVGSHRNWNQHDTDLSDRTEYCTFATGCLMLIPRNVIEKVGELSEEYFLYAEDTDYCCRVMHQGYRILYCNAAVVYHKVNVFILYVLKNEYLMETKDRMLAKIRRN